MPPLKRFRDMEHLSGGEKTMAALALLFAVHSYQPSPFFVLDEVDAALDSVNVTRLIAYIRRNAGPGMQFIVISLKPSFFEGSETLVGVMRDQTANSSKTLTLDVSCESASITNEILTETNSYVNTNQLNVLMKLCVGYRTIILSSTLMWAHFSN
jgi:chromosome segregation ATPase